MITGRTLTHHRRLVLGLGTAAALVTAGTVTTGAFAHEVSNTSAQVVKRNPAPTPKVTDVRWAKHTGDGGYDRIVFEFSGKAPGYDVRYVSSPATCGEGKAVDLGTPRHLQVKFFPATAHSYGPSTYAISKLNSIKKLKKTCDFEADVTWILGIDHKAGFHVKTLSNPTRIYVDVAH